VSRSTAPVFVVGSPRSGTTLLYHMLLSAGGFANYRAETHVFNTLAPRFGNLGDPENRRAMTDVFIRSDMFRVSGLDPASFRATIEANCRNAGDFLRLFMESLCKEQGTGRWAETTPVHILHVPEIKATIPDALFVHVVRDGRDVAVSMMKQGWIEPYWFDRDTPELAAGAFWMYVAERGDALGSRYAADYHRVSYEELVAKPQATLDALGEFIAQPLSYDEILRAGVGSVSKPNTSFPESGAGFHGRWKSAITEERARALDALLAPALARFGYETDGPGESMRRAAYNARFRARDMLKQSPLGRRYVSLSLFEPGAVKKLEVEGAT
jgi:hypothetical protein